MQRLRSEYRLLGLGQLDLQTSSLDSGSLRCVSRSDHAALAQLLLDAYAGSVDDEGENLDDALSEITEYFERLVWPHSYVVASGEQLQAMSLMIVSDGVHYINPVATASSHKRRGLGRTAVMTSIRSLVDTSIDQVGATITDGNVPSERLFASLGFARVGPWPPHNGLKVD